MDKNVLVSKSDTAQPCHWCVGGFLLVADRAIETNKTVLCEPHMDEFVAAFREAE